MYQACYASKRSKSWTTLKNLSFVVLLCAHGSLVKAQSSEEVDISKNTPIQKLITKAGPRPKFLIINYSLLSDTEANNSTTGQTLALENFYSLDIHAKFPIVVKPDLMVLGGVKYAQTTYKLTSDENLPGIAQINSTNLLKKAGGELIIKKNIVENNFVFGYSSFTLNSDRIRLSEFPQQLNFVVTLLRGKRINEDSEFGLGAGVGSVLGKFVVFPVISYSHRFNSEWFLSIIGPKQVKLRYSRSDRIFYHGMLEANTNRFQVHRQNIDQDIQFKHGEITSSLSMEAEIHDWLWFKIRIGHKIPLSFYYSELGNSKPDQRIAEFAMFTLFAVVPRTLMKKAKTR